MLYHMLNQCITVLCRVHLGMIAVILEKGSWNKKRILTCAPPPPAILEVEPRALCLLAKNSTTDPQPFLLLILRQGLVKFPRLALNLNVTASLWVAGITRYTHHAWLLNYFYHVEASLNLSSFCHIFFSMVHWSEGLLIFFLEYKWASNRFLLFPHITRQAKFRPILHSGG